MVKIFKSVYEFQTGELNAFDLKRRKVGSAREMLFRGRQGSYRSELLYGMIRQKKPQNQFTPEWFGAGVLSAVEVQVEVLQ